MPASPRLFMKNSTLEGPEFFPENSLNKRDKRQKILSRGRNQA
jgi:hypothetical protein